MSSKNPSKYQLLQWINCCVGCHDLICCCDEPVKHLITTIFNKKEQITVTRQQKQQIEECLTITEEEDTNHVGEDGFGPGDLERIFAEDGDGENTDG